MTVNALHTQCLIEAGHDERDISVRRQHLQVLVGGGRTGAAAGWLLRDERNGCEKPQEEKPHE
jgi:hypothetical protein